MTAAEKQAFPLHKSNCKLRNVISLFLITLQRDRYVNLRNVQLLLRQRESTNIAARAELRHEFRCLQTDNMDTGRAFLRPDNSVTRTKPPPVA